MSRDLTLEDYESLRTRLVAQVARTLHIARRYLLEDASAAEIARELKTTEGAVRKVVSRIRRRKIALK